MPAAGPGCSGAPTSPIGVRVSTDELAVLSDLQRAVGCTRTELLRVALRLVAERDASDLRERVASLPRAVERPERNRAMWEARAAGATWAQIAERFGLAMSSARWAVMSYRAEQAANTSESPRLRVVPAPRRRSSGVIRRAGGG
jgi:hypothetical protein